MKSKIAMMTVLVLGLQSAAFAVPRKGPIGPRPSPRLPEGKVVVNVIDGVTMTARDLAAVIDNIKSIGRKEEAPTPRPGLRARRIIGVQQYVLEPFSVKFPPLATASLRGPKTLDTRVSLAVTSMRSLAQRNRGVSPALREVDLTLSVVVTQKRGQHGVTTQVVANRAISSFGDVLHAVVTPELRRRLPLGPRYDQRFVGVVCEALLESFPKVWRVARR